MAIGRQGVRGSASGLGAAPLHGFSYVDAMDPTHAVPLYAAELSAVGRCGLQFEK